MHIDKTINLKCKILLKLKIIIISDVNNCIKLQLAYSHNFKRFVKLLQINSIYFDRL